MALPLEVIKMIANTNTEKLKSRYIYESVFPAIEVATSQGVLLIDDDAQVNQLNLKPTRAFDKAPQVNTADRQVSYTMHNVRRRYFVDPDKLENMPEEFRNKEIAKGIYRTLKSTYTAFEYWASRQLFNSTIWSSFTPATLWSNTTTSKAYTDLQTAAYNAGIAGGIAANTVIFSPDAFRQWALNEEVSKKFPNIDFTTATPERIRGAMTGVDLDGIQNIYVGRAQFTSSNEGQTVVKENIWKNGVWIGFIDPDVESDESETAVVGLEIMNKKGVNTRTYKDEELDEDSEWVESKGKRGFKVIDSTKGYFIENPV